MKGSKRRKSLRIGNIVFGLQMKGERMEKEVLEKRKKAIYNFICSDLYVPMKAKELAIMFQIAKDKRADLLEVLDALLEEGKIALTKRGKYVKAEVCSVAGIFTSHEKGFGFVKVEGEQEEDIFIGIDDVNGAFYGDKVLVAIKSERQGVKKREGVIIRILERGLKEVVGTYQKSRSFGFVIPDNPKITSDIFVPAEKSNGAVNGHKVVVKLTDYGGKNHKPEGKVIQILGHKNDPGVDILSIVKGYDLPVSFPQEVKEQLKTIPDQVSLEEWNNRLDLRDVQTVTIDGEDAKDLDDAITIKRTDRGYELGVHIADVTHYVKEYSPLDREALKRGTSVYLVDRVIPMLPHQLSNGICSLNQGVERLALSCIMEIDSKGNVVDHKIAETVICVDKRMDYTSVNRVLEDQSANNVSGYEKFEEMIFLMKELSEIVRERRIQRGAIDFEFPESKIILDENGKPIDIHPYERNAATKLIEDFMLLANETIAEDYFWQDIPFIYRSHEKPELEKIQKLSTFIHNFGYTLKISADEVHPKEIQKLLEKVSHTQEEPLISRLTLRSMKQAKYTVHSEGHFGLAARYYCHFTSPIRRYPDLQIHRIIKENLHGEWNEKRRKHYDKILEKVAEQSSMTERRAEEAERETVKLKKAEYMKKFIGKRYEGIISSITRWGIYVELPNTVEGMVHVTKMLDDYYYYDEERYEMIGETTGKCYKLGQMVSVKLDAVDTVLKTIDFRLLS